MKTPTDRPFRFAGLVLMAAAIAACGGEAPPQAKHPPSAAPGFDIPTGKDLPGWSRVTEPEYYEAGNLWEYINGQADFYIDYGFERVDTAEYRNDASSSSVVLEAYRMGRPQEAFGIFAAERTGADRPIEIGAEAYLGSNVLGFWHGRSYVKLTSFEEDPTVQQSLIGLAEIVSSRFTEPGHELETLHLFPVEHRVAATERFIPQNFLGQPYLTDAYRVDYDSGGERLELFVVESGTSDEARSDFDRLVGFYRGRDRTDVAEETVAGIPMTTVDGPSKLVLFRINHRLCGAIGLEDLESGRTGARALAASIERHRSIN